VISIVFGIVSTSIPVAVLLPPRQPLINQVRVPALKGVRCGSLRGRQCTLSAEKLFLIDKVSQIQILPIP